MPESPDGFDEIIYAGLPQAGVMNDGETARSYRRKIVMLFTDSQVSIDGARHELTGHVRALATILALTRDIGYTSTGVARELGFAPNVSDRSFPVVMTRSRQRLSEMFQSAGGTSLIDTKFDGGLLQMRFQPRVRFVDASFREPGRIISGYERARFRSVGRLAMEADMARRRLPQPRRRRAGGRSTGPAET